MFAITLPEAAQIAGWVTAILSCGVLALRLAVNIPGVRRVQRWVRDGWAEDRAEQLDSVLAFNGTGSFRSDMRHFYKAVNEHMDRVDRHMTDADAERARIRSDLEQYRQQQNAD